MQQNPQTCARPFTQFRWLVLAAIFATLLLSGCGDRRLSKSEYVDRVNRIEKSATAGIQKVQTARPENARELAEQARAASATAEQASSELEGLEPPAEWQDEHQVLVDAYAGVSQALEQLAVAAENNDAQALVAVHTQMAEHNERAEAAKKSITSTR